MPDDTDGPEAHMESRHLSGDDYEIPDGLATGVYSNLAVIQHSGPGKAVEEFTFDFVYTGRGLKKPRLVARVIMSPAHALRFYKALEQNLGRVKGLDEGGGRR